MTSHPIARWTTQHPGLNPEANTRDATTLRRSGENAVDPSLLHSLMSTMLLLSDTIPGVPLIQMKQIQRRNKHLQYSATRNKKAEKDVGHFMGELCRNSLAWLKAYVRARTSNPSHTSSSEVLDVGNKKGGLHMSHCSQVAPVITTVSPTGFPGCPALVQVKAACNPPGRSAGAAVGLPGQRPNLTRKLKVSTGSLVDVSPPSFSTPNLKECPICNGPLCHATPL
ncbi:uncharacterized protein LOC142489292 [Ascaphus truei]|uniref:uncharacterized protein LOC142489292 n=1 Tax=Ascaphus truei TaxID=8439 RepID=UPI003F597D83